jgi:aminoglycoside phosphotransferase (APT) family kinase protein
VDELVDEMANEMTDGQAGPSAADLEKHVAAWLHNSVGPVISIERQGRWRPAWTAEVERDGETLALYVRGDRDSMEDNMLASKEAEVLLALEAAGIPVPHVYGVVDGYGAAVMDLLPGRANLATAVDDEERASVIDEYVEILARVHAIDPQVMRDIGLRSADTPEQLALGYFDSFFERYTANKRRPEPLIEFGIKWLRRNIPQQRPPAVPVLGDPGQFMFQDGRVTGILDVELMHIGDVAHDLGGLRLRDATEPFGDLRRVLRRYQAASGVALDADAIEFHTAQFALSVPMSLTGALHTPPPVPEILQYIDWFHQFSLCGIEAIAVLADVPLGDVSLPEPVTNPYTDVAAGLAATIESLPVDGDMASFQRRSTAQVARFCARVSTYGAAIMAEDLDDQAELLGRRYDDWQEGTAALEDYILAAGPEQDAALIGLLHRRVMRQMRLLEPVLSRTGYIAHLTPVAELLQG